jgi:hypothetical protein
MASDSINPREYGQLEADVRHLQSSMQAMQTDIKAMRDLLEQSRGGWKMLMLLGGAASSFGAIAGWIAHNLSFIK